MTNARKDHTTVLRMLAIVGTTWTLYVAFAVLVAAINTESWFIKSDLAWPPIVLPVWLALLGTGAGWVVGLASTPGSPEPHHRPSWVWWLGAIPTAPVLVWAFLRPVIRTPNPTPVAVDQLVRLPRLQSLSFVTLMTIACIFDAAWIGRHYGWSRRHTMGILGMWLGLLIPFAALMMSWTRSHLGLHHLVLSTPTRFARRFNLRLRLTVTASLVCAGLVSVPLSLGYLWSVDGPSTSDIQQASRLANQIVSAAQHGLDAKVGLLLGRHSNSALRLHNSRWGNDTIVFPPRSGLHDLNADGKPDVVVRGHDHTWAAVSLPPPHRRPALPLVFGGFLALLVATILHVQTSTGFVRDLRRSAKLTRAVTRGNIPLESKQHPITTQEVHQLILAVNQLVHRITETNIASYVAIEKAKEADRLKNQFLANMSHDLRAPLNSILGFSELLVSGIEGDLDPEQLEMLEIILDNGRILLQQINDILDTAKIEASRLEIHAEPTPVVTLVHRAIHTVKSRLNTEVDIVVNASPGLPPVFVDPYRSVQALENVLGFASEHLKQGRIHVKLRVARSHRGRMVQVNIETPERPATTEQLARARRGFSRIPGHRGLALGLPIAASILELQGGALHIDDQNEGIVFCTLFPAPEARRTIDVSPLAQQARA